MVDALIDANIVIDVLRGYTPARNWYSSNTMKLGVNPIVMLEVLNGAPNRPKQNQIVSLLQPIPRVDLTSDDFTWAIQQTITYKLSHNIGYEDCLIASVNHRLQLPLFTRNLKHFTPLLGSLAQAPYA